MPTVAEQRFLEQVPSLLRDMSKSLEIIAGKKQAEKPEKYVWVFTAEQAWDYVTEDVIVRTFDSEKKARKFLHDFVYKPASDGSIEDSDEESIAKYAKRKGWDVECDEPDHYRAYPEGSYPEEHIECRITKCKVE